MKNQTQSYLLNLSLFLKNPTIPITVPDNTRTASQIPSRLANNPLTMSEASANPNVANKKPIAVNKCLTNDLLCSFITFVLVKYNIQHTKNIIKFRYIE